MKIRYKKPKKMNIPEGLVIREHDATWWPKKSIYGKIIFGWYSPGKKLIDIYPPKWIPKMFGLRKRIIETIRNHELAHAWGINECLSDDFSCIMFERNDSFIEKLYFPVQLIRGLGFCSKCEEFLKKKGINEL